MSKNLFLKLLLAGSTAIGVAVAADCAVKSGAYAGIGAGVSHLGGKNKVNHVDTTAVQYFYNNGANSSTSAAGDVFAGYGMRFSGIWAAIELTYKFDNLKSKTTFEALNTHKPKTLSVKSSGAYGGAAHFGVLANDKAVVYFIAGVESRRFKVQYTDANNDIDVSGQPKKSYRSTAFVPGVGVRLTVAKNISFKTEYKYAMHKNKKIVGAKAGTETVALKNSPKIHSFQVGVAYTF